MNVDRESLLAAMRRGKDPRGLRPHELVAEMNADAKSRHRVRALLGELADEGLLEKTEGARYRIVGWVPVVEPLVPASTPGAPPSAQAAKARPGEKVAPPGSPSGSIRMHPAGYGFVARDDGEEDVFVAAKNRGAALDGDRVAITTWAGFKGTEGRVVDVLSRGRAKITGTLRVGASTGPRAHAERGMWLETDDPRLLGHVGLTRTGTPLGHEGQAVVAEIVEYPTEPEAPLLARVIKVLGDPDDPRTEVAKVIACAEIPDEFPDEVRDAAERAPSTVRIEDEIDRVDLRDRGFLTIDPETARDFDDAVFVEDGPRAGIERLWVAVADVSHYVRPGTALDREARVRGVSVYLPDRAIPMLPHQLSAGICSLNPEVDRLAMVARLDVDGAGRIVDQQFMAAVIRSRARLDYAGVAAALAGDLRGPRARYADHLPSLRRMQALSLKLRALRTARGSLDFDLPEAQVILDDDDPKRVRDVRKARSLPEVRGAYQMIEDFMLAANEAVARWFRERNIDTMWRIHAPPKEERLEEFARLAEGFGLAVDATSFPREARDPRNLRAFLEQIKGRPMERALSFLLLRSLKQAVYDVVNVGHFGLAAPEYLHFTSPIRRYPDLIVHRLLKNGLRAEGLTAGGVKQQPWPEKIEIARWAADSSSNERRAMQAEREVVDMYRAFLMRERVGEEFDGTISAVTSFGMFIEIADPFVEGLVKIDKLGYGFRFDEEKLRLVADKSGRSFALGDAVRVRIEDVSVPRRKIDLSLVGHEALSPRAAEPKRGDGPRRRREVPGKKAPASAKGRRRRG